ncbi:hypothetical protein C8A05DRAFT_41528 [Staphylotrichum tortipilum]|uniref:Transcription factor RfeG n=1 Tax=Staphylotrichum tortipilum TaxID=2831512 RepID=A0AAN6RW10_9PEZI|nr:hypothetical protein C8A05DRAFT_41528 [Staphylotrichum longicolle]
MTGRPSNRASQPQMQPAPARQNEYFVPRDGIDREVISSDICRYLGRDALVRPGTYESQDGRPIQGYYITAYRNLTSAMIQDLKADSARWEQERRAASRLASAGPGGTAHSSQPNDIFVRRDSNSPAGREIGGQDYSSWKNRLREQEYQQAAYGSGMDIDYPPAASAGASAGYPGQQYGQAPPVSYTPTAYPPQAAAPQYAAQPQYTYAAVPAQTQYSPQPPNERYNAIPPPAPIPVSHPADPSPFFAGSNFQTVAPGYSTAGSNRMPQAMPHPSAAPSRTYPATAGPSAGYGTEPDPYYQQQQAGNSGAQSFPIDGVFGRGAYMTTATNPAEASSDDLGSPAGPAQRQGYPTPSDQHQQQYEDLQTPGMPMVTTPTSMPPTQVTSGGVPAPRRDRDRDSEPREREREREREHRSDHRSRREPERDDRDRNRHRHR